MRGGVVLSSSSGSRNARVILGVAGSLGKDHQTPTVILSGLVGIRTVWWARQGSNLRPPACKAWANRVSRYAGERLAGTSFCLRLIVYGTDMHRCYIAATRSRAPFKIKPTGCPDSAHYHPSPVWRCSMATLASPVGCHYLTVQRGGKVGVDL